MSKIIVYEARNFQGISREFTSDVVNLCDHNLNDRVSSLKVIGNPWVVYRDVNFVVPLAVYEEGEYAQVKHLGTISSLQLVTEDLSNPQIILYEHVNYQGKSVVINCETTLCSGAFNDIVSSHKVQRGAWALYEHGDQTGRLMVARAGRAVPDYGSFNDCLSYLHPLKPGRTVLKAVLDWENKETKINSYNRNSMSSMNSSDQVKPFSPNLKRSYDALLTESFNFTSSAGIGIGTKFDLDLSELKKELELDVEDTFTVEKGANNTKTEKKTVEVSLPATVPPHTKLTVDLVTMEMNVKVPVKLVFDKIEVSCGEFVCYSEVAFTTEVKQEAV